MISIWRAVTSCSESGKRREHHFAGAGKQIELGQSNFPLCKWGMRGILRWLPLRVSQPVVENRKNLRPYHFAGSGKMVGGRKGASQIVEMMA